MKQQPDTTRETKGIGAVSEQQQRRVVRPRAKSAASKQMTKPEASTPAVSPWEGLMDAGDKLDFGATMEVKNKRGMSYWPKAGVTITLRPGESVEQAKERAAAIVHGFLTEQVQEYLR